MLVVIQKQLTCCRCGYQWTPRGEAGQKVDVRSCPKCKSPLWDVEPGVKKT